ncbi:hypothetical protein O4H66_17270 [Comamonadaceae bacterium G21597-S1]|nr:hypothetical protein [Comamonadaceae bacterium G21597-S1]
MTDPAQPFPAPADLQAQVPETPHDKMLQDYMQRQLQQAIRLRQVRTPQGLASLFPGLGKKHR